MSFNRIYFLKHALIPYLQSQLAQAQQELARLQQAHSTPGRQHKQGHNEDKDPHLAAGAGTHPG